MKKNDWILIAAIFMVALSFFGWRIIVGYSGAEEVEVTVDGEEFGIYSLNNKNAQKISIHGTNTLLIENGKVDMIDANCPDKLCVHQKAISANGESIICLPNKVVVTIKSKTDSEYDAVTN